MAKKEEVEIPGDDYEVIPVTPLRRLEKRLDAIETTKTMNNMEKFIDKVIDMVELNQKIVEDMVKSNQSLREDLGVLIGKIDTLQSKIGGIVEMIESAAESDIAQTNTENTATAIKPIVDQMQAMSKQTQETNATLIQNLENIDRKLKRIAPPTQQFNSARDLLARRSTPQQQTEQ